MYSIPSQVLLLSCPWSQPPGLRMGRLDTWTLILDVLKLCSSVTAFPPVNPDVHQETVWSSVGTCRGKLKEITAPLKLSLYLPPGAGTWNSVCVGRVSDTHPCKAGGRKLGLWLAWPLWLLSSLPISSRDWGADSTSWQTACGTAVSNHHPFVLILIRSAEPPFIPCPWG